ncbi:DUF6449 domain-containing protein [Gracilibacillus dipsosauri]|uniref:DUF6449 domain-containing protein n=1 Tax=Gracilibacillus dipsosauri TaxID=178340 RepID=UPI0024095629
MQSRTFYFKKELLKQSFRSTGWIGIAYFVVLVFLFPLQILMNVTSEELQHTPLYYEGVENIFETNGVLHALLMITVPVLAALFAFRYLQVRGFADFVHSLPIKRSSLFHQHFMMGYLNLLIPLLLNGLLMYMMERTMNVDEFFSTHDIGSWLIYSIVVVSIIYSFTVLVGMITGISAVQLVLSYIFLIFPAGILTLLYRNLGMLLKGFSPGINWQDQAYRFSPISRSIEMSNSEVKDVELWIFSILAIVCYVLALVLYRVRSIEAASQALAFPFLKPIFKFGVTFCFMLLGGAYFESVPGNYIGWITFGYIFGAFLGYLLAEMLIQKTWRIWGKWKGLMIYISISMIVLASIVFDWFGYVDRVPQAHSIEGIEVIDEMMFHHNALDLEIDDPSIMTAKADIEAILDLHEALIASDLVKENTQYHKDYISKLYFTYYLENGNKMKRQYYVPDTAEFKELLAPIYEEEVFKKMNRPWLFLDKVDYSQITIHVRDREPQNIFDPRMIEQIVEQLRKDYLALNYEEVQQISNATVMIDLILDEQGNFFYMEVPSSYENTLEFISENFN